MKDHVWGASDPGRTLTSASPSHPHLEDHAKADSHTSITAKLRKLLYHTVLDTSSKESGVSTPRRPVSVTLGPPVPKGKALLSWLATSSQASPQAVMPDNNGPPDQSPEGACPPTKGLGVGTGILPKEVISLQEEMNRAMECLLMNRSSLDAHQRKQVSDFQVALHQNQDVATETIREAKAHCAVTVWEAKSHCAPEIREAESYSMSQAHSIQQPHSEGMQHLKTDALEEEGRDRLSFLSTCGVALQAFLPKGLGILMYPFHLLTGNMSLATVLSLPCQASTTREESTLMSTPAAPTPSWGAKWPHLPNPISSSPLLGGAAGTNDEPPT